MPASRKHDLIQWPTVDEETGRWGCRIDRKRETSSGLRQAAVAAMYDSMHATGQQRPGKRLTTNDWSGPACCDFRSLQKENDIAEAEKCKDFRDMEQSSETLDRIDKDKSIANFLERTAKERSELGPREAK
jgi:hypothetical protein